MTFGEIWDCPSLLVHMADKSTLTVSGQLHVDATGDAWLETEVPGFAFSANFADAQTIVGTTSSGLSIEIDQAYVSRSTSSTDAGHSIVTWVFVECRISDATITNPSRTEVFLTNVRFFGRCPFVLDGHSCVLEAISTGDDQRRGLVRGRLDLANTDHLHIVALLTLAQRCPIGVPLVKSYAGDQLAFVRIRISKSDFDSSNPLIPRDGRKLGAFLTQTLPTFIAKASDYELRRLIDYYALSVQQSYAEQKFLLASVFMEAFKFYWAKNVAKKPTDIKANGLIRGFIKAHGAKGKPIPYGFEELLTEACAAIGYTTTFSFIDDRNALFHSGAPGAYQLGMPMWPALRAELQKLYRQIDDVLLRILDHSGPILRWDTPNTEELFP